MRGGNANAVERAEMQTSIGGSAREFGHSNGSRETGSDSVVQKQRNTDTENAHSNSDYHNAATASSKLRVRYNATDRDKRETSATGKPTTPTKSEPRIYATGSRYILLVPWVSRQ